MIFVVPKATFSNWGENIFPSNHENLVQLHQSDQLDCVYFYNLYLREKESSREKLLRIQVAEVRFGKNDTLANKQRRYTNYIYKGYRFMVTPVVKYSDMFSSYYGMTLQ